MQKVAFLQLIDDSVDGKSRCVWGGRPSLLAWFSGEFCFLFVICSVAAPPRASVEEEGGVVGIVQGGVLGLEVRDGLGKLSYFDSIWGKALLS